MSKLDESEIRLYGDEQFAQLAASMSILSDVQEQISVLGFQDSVLDDINHAKRHLVRAMVLRHKEKMLPDQLMYNEE